MENATTLDNSSNATTERTNLTELQVDPDEFYYKLASDIYGVIAPILLIGGLIGHVLTFLVMQRKAIRTSSVAIFMSALAVADSLVLILDFVNNWFFYILKIYVLGNDGFCQFHRWGFRVVYTYSAWLVASVSVERFIAVWFPLKARVICTIRSAVITVSVMPVMLGIIYSNNLWSWFINEEGKCDIRAAEEFYISYVGPWVISTLYSFCPLTIICISNTCIIYKLILAGRRRNSLAGSDVESARDRATQRIAVTVMAICLAFCITTVPTTIWYSLIFASGDFVESGAKMALYETIIQTIGLSNHAINFVLYVLTSQNFRNELGIMLHIRKNQPTISTPGAKRTNNLGAAKGDISSHPQETSPTSLSDGPV